MFKNLSKNMKDILKAQTELLDMKTTMSKVKHTQGEKLIKSSTKL